MPETVVGHGQLVSGNGDSQVGRFAALLSPADLLRILDGEEGPIVGYIEHPNVTMMAPVSGRLAALVCEHGSETAHVAIMARELGLPCIVQTKLTVPVAELDGRPTRLLGDGTLVSST